MIEEQNSEKTDQAAGKLIQGTAALPKVPAKLKTGIPVPDQPPEPADGEAASFSEPVPLRQSDNNQSRAGVSPDPDTLLRLRALRMSPPPAGHCSIGIENAVPETGAAPGIFQSRS